MRLHFALSVSIGTFLATAFLANQLPAETQTLFIASPPKASIFACDLDTKSGAMTNLRPAAEEINSGFLAWHPTLPILYAASSEKTASGQPNGSVRAFSVAKDGKLSLIDTAMTQDTGTTHIEVARDGSAVLVCHYGGKGTSAIPVHSDGTMEDSVSQIAHEGSGPDAKRQTAPHPHGVAISHNSRFVCVADLGNDHVEVFGIGPKAQLDKATFWKAAPGAGPRHVMFHPNGKWLYCINELDSTIAALSFNSETGAITELQVVSTLPQGFSESNTTAELAIHPNGKFLYGSNRGHESTAVFTIDQDGKLTFVEHEPTQGKHPRFVGLDPSGKIYIAANMNTDNLVSFHIDQQTGELTASGHQLSVPKPMCVLFRQ